MNRVRWASLGAVVLLGLQFWFSAASADQVYHSQHYDLSPIGGAPLNSGFVENIHANGPNVYAHEIYQVNGASPDFSYDVQLSIWTLNTNCSGDPDLQFVTDTIATDAAGNGEGQAVFTPEDADGLRGLTVSAQWQLLSEGSAVYETGCEVVVLD
jgi:hypothetical protein